MKQTNNAIKFLMAQYRAIFKNAYFKGMASAVLLTAGLSVAGGAQAANFTNASWLSSADHENIVIAGSGAATASELENLQIRLTPNVTATEWNNTVTIEGGEASNESGDDKNYLTLSGAGNATLSGTGSLIINGEDTNKGLAIASRFADGDININIRNITVENGTLLAEDLNHKKSGSITIAADEIAIGGNGIDETKGATAILKLSATAGTEGIGLTIGRTASSNQAASTINVNKGGVVLLSAADDNDNTNVIGAALNINEDGLLVTSGGESGSNNINTDTFNVTGGVYVGNTTHINSHETTINGNLLVSGGSLHIRPQALDTNNDNIKEAGSFTIGSGANVQLEDNIAFRGSTNDDPHGHMVVEDSASLIAKNDTAAILVRGVDDITTPATYSSDGPTLTISSAKLKSFFNTEDNVTYQPLAYTANNTLEVQDPKADPIDAGHGALNLDRGGVLEFNDTNRVYLNDFYFKSGNATTSGSISIGSSGGIVKGHDIAITKVLEEASGTDVDADLALYVEADTLTLGSNTYSSSDSLGFEAARAQDNIHFVDSDGTFILADTVNADRKYYQQQTNDDGTVTNTFNLNSGNGTITGANIQIGDNAGTDKEGNLNVLGGAWTSDSNITIVSGSLAVKADDADGTSPSLTNNGNPASLTLTGNVTFSGSGEDHANINVTGASGADATLDLTKADLVFTNSAGAAQSGSITVSGSVTEVSESSRDSNGSPFGDAATNDFYAQHATRGQIGWGKLLLNDRDFNEFLGDNGAKTKFTIGSGGYVYVNGTLTGEHSFDKFSSGTAAHTVNFTGTGVLDINGTLNLFTGVKGTPSTAASDFDIGEGTIAADIIDLHNYNEDRNGVTGLTIAGGTLEVRQGLSTNTDSLTFSGDGTAQLTLAGDFSDTGVASQGTITTAANGVITLGTSGAIAVQGGDWTTSADLSKLVTRIVT